jgi:hypothetical protein
MKKVLLSAAVIFGAYFATAQTCTVGLTETTAYDDFSSDTDPGDENGGLFLFGEDELAGDDNPNFKAVLTRNATAGKLDIVLTQAQGEYVPFGVAFGDDNYLDLSANAKFSFEFTNSGTADVIVRINIKDANGKLIDSYASVAKNGSTAWYAGVYEHTIEKEVKAGKTEVFSGDFTGGYFADFGNEMIVGGFDFAKVTNIQFTVVNSANTGDPAYAPLALTDYPVSIGYYKVGCGDEVGTKSAVKLETAVYPNPATSVVHFGQTLTNVAVYNSNGILVETLNSASSINVESFKSGVYLINSTEGSTRFVVK